MTGKVSGVLHRVVMFRGGVSCRRDPEGPLGLTLVGWTADRPNEKASLAFSGRAPDGLPEALEDPSVEYVGPETYRIKSGPHEWVVEAGAVHLHREIASAFYAVVVPRPVPWKKRVFWWLVLAMAANPFSKRVLLALRGR